jgi:hypothetical protein
MNREQHLQNHFPLEDGTTYTQNLDNVMCEYSGLPSVQSYEPKGAGVGGESLKENFIDSNSIDSLTKEQYDILYDIVYKDTERLVINEYNKIIDSAPSGSNSLDRDWMYNWIRKHSGK